MKVLVLGGTQFSGRSFVEQAAKAGHEVVVLHRSTQDPGLPVGVRRLVGDRDPEKGNGLGKVRALLEHGERFDSVIDMCGYAPRVVSASCELLREATDHYLFVSTISVYPRSADEIPHEDWALSQLEQLSDPTTEEVTGATYGGLKVLCELAVRKHFADRACIIRPGVIAGPNDPTDRITWWARALTTQEAVLIPAPPAGLAGFIDARDLAAFFIKCARNHLIGTFNATGPEPALALGDFVRRARTALNSKAQLIEAPHKWLAQRDIKPWQDIPTWLPEDSQSMYRVSNERAIGAGLIMRPLENTINDLNAWDIKRGRPALKAGMALEKMSELTATARV